eukprot:jgi/Ulvmu1/1445/UM011_0175.1
MQQLQQVDPESRGLYEQLKKQYHAAIQAQAKGEEVMKDLEKKSRFRQLMLAQLSKLEADATTYQNVGKAYILAPRADIIKQYESDYVELLEIMKKCKEDKVTVEKKVESSQKELREFLSSNPRIAHAVLRP